ncbi:MAG: PKD domain-containing protein [Bacteroidetes bacterium]|nr:PKD domain-containing protein [Bacteroidota bacterium]
MKVKTVYFLLLVLALLSTALVQQARGNPLITNQLKAISITVTGKLLNDSTGNPVKNHSVFVNVPYIGYNSTVYTDTSGNYADTIHDLPGLGDTVLVSTYDCHNTLHIQSQPIHSYSIIINFFICESFSPQCTADFIAELDSSSVTPYKYRFFDLSTGNPDHWSWNFGDGTTSSERNPVHAYTNSGHYKACLSISRDNLDAPCADSSCTYIYTPRYYSIGGHVFIGDHPINNPVSTGDTGIAYLYKLVNNHVVAFDTVTFTYLGYYSFPHLLKGDYIVKVTLTPGSLNAWKYAPAYYLQAVYWQQSQLLGVTDTNVFNFDIYLKRANDSISGSGRISGKVQRHIQTSGMFILNRSEVLLLDSLKNLITYTLSDAAGNFSFPDLPYGNYLLFVESTGKFSKFSQVRISLQNPIADTLVLDIYDHNVTGINEIAKDNAVVAGSPFPNPSEGAVSIPLTVNRPVDLITTVYSIQSVHLLESGSHFNPGSYHLKADLATLAPGIYILVIKTLNGDRICNAKIIKY